jgi:molybdopterin-guanine dinucleotide biosynthesis protein A
LTVIVVAGGGSRRLGGVDKAALVINGRSLLDRVLQAWPDDADMVAVGPRRATSRPVRWCQEFPPGGGPLSGVAAALPGVTSDLVALVGVDLPLIGPGVSPLVNAASQSVRSGGDGAWLSDSAGQVQPLAACVNCEALRAGLPTTPRDQSIRRVLWAMALTAVPVPDEWLRDVDTVDDVAAVTNILIQQEGKAP